MPEITDEMRLEVAKQAKEAALKKRDEIQNNVKEDLMTTLTTEEIQMIVKENQNRAESKKNLIEKNINKGDISEKPTTDEILKMRKDMMEDVYVDIKKYKSLRELNEAPRIVKTNREDRLINQIRNKKNIGQNLGKMYD